MPPACSPDQTQERIGSRRSRMEQGRASPTRIEQCGRFRYAKEIVLHHVETGGADRLVGLALSQGLVASLLKRGVSEEEIGMAALREETRRALGDATVPWYWSYRVRLGVK